MYTHEHQRLFGVGFVGPILKGRNQNAENEVLDCIPLQCGFHGRPRLQEGGSTLLIVGPVISAE